MKCNKGKRGIVFLLMMVLVFSSLGTAAFADKPVKPEKLATIEVVESTPLVLSLGEMQVSTDLLVKDHNGELPEVTNISTGTANIKEVSIKKKVSTYELTYIKPVNYDGLGEEEVTVTVYNIVDTPTLVIIPIQIEVDEPPMNNAPEILNDPFIPDHLVAGETVTPTFGAWTDELGAGLPITRTWLLDGSPIDEIPSETDPLYLEPAWAGLTIQLKEVANDGEFIIEVGSLVRDIQGATPPPTEDLIYVALGDSIATGTVAPTFENETTYVSYFGTFLSNETKRTVKTKDFSEDGDQTSHLLARLNGGDSDMIAQLKVADIITLSIGGNNLMSAAKYHTLLFGFIPVDYYDFDNINLTKAENGRAAFAVEFPQIVKKIRSYNSSAQIIVNTIFNPFKETQDAGNYGLVESYFSRTDKKGINDVILATPDIDVAFVHDAFDSGYYEDVHYTKDQLTYMYITNTYFGFELRNPHPKQMGQQIIEKMHEDAYRQIP